MNEQSIQTLSTYLKDEHQHLPQDTQLIMDPIQIKFLQSFAVLETELFSTNGKLAHNFCIDTGNNLIFNSKRR